MTEIYCDLCNSRIDSFNHGCSLSLKNLIEKYIPKNKVEFYIKYFFKYEPVNFNNKDICSECFNTIKEKFEKNIHDEIEEFYSFLKPVKKVKCIDNSCTNIFECITDVKKGELIQIVKNHKNKFIAEKIGD